MPFHGDRCPSIMIICVQLQTWGVSGHGNGTSRFCFFELLGWCPPGTWCPTQTKAPQCTPLFSIAFDFWPDLWPLKEHLLNYKVFLKNFKYCFNFIQVLCVYKTQSIIVRHLKALIKMAKNVSDPSALAFAAVSSASWKFSLSNAFPLHSFLHLASADLLGFFYSAFQVLSNNPSLKTIQHLIRFWESLWDTMHYRHSINKIFKC